MIDVILPCPCCGGRGNLDGVYDSGPYDKWFHVTCAECALQTDGTETEKEALELWNTRPKQIETNEPRSVSLLEVEDVLDFAHRMPSWSDPEFNKGWDTALNYIREELILEMYPRKLLTPSES